MYSVGTSHAESSSPVVVVVAGNNNVMFRRAVEILKSTVYRPDRDVTGFVRDRPSLYTAAETFDCYNITIIV